MKNLTPKKMCGLGQCPGVYEEEDGKHLRIIGASIEPGELSARIAAGEAVIRVERALLSNVGGPVSRVLMRMGL